MCKRTKLIYKLVHINHIRFVVWKANVSHAWSDAEVKALISIWGERKYKLGELDGAVRNKAIFVGIQKKLAEQEYARD